MSRICFFVFVEGYEDRYFYDNIIRHTNVDSLSDWCVITAEEVYEGGGGKDVLIKIFKYLRKSKALSQEFQGKNSKCIFFLDKDVDDILGIRLRSPHLVYTQTYDVESYYFRHGNLAKAAAIAGRLETGAVSETLGDSDEWRSRAAANWKDWVVICLYCRKNLKSAGSHFSRNTSEVNTGPFGPVSELKLRSLKYRIMKLSGESLQGFQTSFERTVKTVDRIYKANQHDRIFKGKWYCNFLVEAVRQSARGRRIPKFRLHGMLLNSLVVTLEFNQEWTNHFREPVRKLISERSST